MKYLFTFVFLVVGFISTANAQYSHSYTTRYNNGYNSSQYYYGKKGTTRVNTQRNYNYGGGYNSRTNVYRNGLLKSSSNTYRSPYGTTTTVRRNYNTGRTTIRYKY